SAGYAFFIPELQVSFSNNLPPSSSSFTAECYAITEALQLILNFASKNYLIASDSMSCSLQALNSNPFNSHLSPLILRIKSLIFILNQLNYNIQFLWVPSHTGIHGNEVADNLAKSSSSLIFLPFTQLPHSDFIPLIKQYTSNMWLSLWNDLPVDFASRYRNITPNIPKKNLV
ncbi:RNA-directed DNA polymerase from mobile element jockey, partial [Aphis craccivora]